MSRTRALTIIVLAVMMSACSRTPTTRQLTQEAITAMGGLDRLQGIQTIAWRDGTGTRSRLGQTPMVGESEQPANLKNVIETVDLANQRASLDYEIATQTGFTQHRNEILTKQGDKAVGIEKVAGRPLAVMAPAGLFAWGSQNSPEFLLRRNVISILLAANGSASEDAPEDRDLNGTMYKSGTAKTAEGEEVRLYFDAASKHLVGYEVLDTEAILGDVPAQYLLGDYKDVSGVMVPHKVTIQKGGQPYSEVQFASAAINDASANAVFEIPADAPAGEVDKAVAAADYSPVTLTKVADGLHLARAYSHNTMIVEFPSWLAIVEAPYTEAQSHTLARMLEQQFPGKPIRYAAVTHHHYDHIGGVRGIASYGATILVEKGHEGEVRPLLEAAHTNPPDALDTKRKSGQTVGSLEVYEGKKVIADGAQSLELYPITGNPHVSPMVLAYVPSQRALFQSDLYVPGVGAPGSPAAAHLLQSVRALNLRVDTNVGGHGGVAPFAELAKAAGTATATN